MQQSQQEIENSQDSFIFNISREGFKEIQKSRLTLDQIFYLEACKYSLDLQGIVDSDKLMTWRQSLARKGLITDSQQVTIEGETLLKLVGSGLPFKGALEERKSKVASDFDRWWLAYPPSNKLEIAGKVWKGTRGLRVSKEKCRTLFETIVNEGEYTADDIIRALEYEISLKTEESIRKNENAMGYMKNSHAWLYQRAFEGLVEESKGNEGTKSINNQFNGEI